VRRPARRRVAAVLIIAVIAGGAAAGCGAPPWRMGAPLDGRPSIPARQARPTVGEARAAARLEHQAGRTVLEVAALLDIDAADKLDAPEGLRLAELLVVRAAELHALGRAIPESRDLEAVARLDPARGARLVTARAVAAAAAGDAWKAIGALPEAQAAYALAASLGGKNAGDLGLRPARLPALPAAGTPPADVERWLLGGVSLSARLVPLAAASPAILDGGPRGLAWAELLLGEDPTSPDVLEVVAVIFGRAGRLGGTERMLMELVYHTPDRAAGLARGAAVWERVGRPREACAQWIRAARWRDDAEDPAWRQAIACTRRDPGAGDWREIRGYVLARARPERRDAIAAELEGRLPQPGDGGAGDARPDGGAGER
jgi:hypothetical protein